MRILCYVAAILVGLLTLNACGGGGGGGTSGTVLTGVASKGIIRGGAVQVYALNADGSTGQLLQQTATDNDGGYRADLGSYRGAVLVVVSGSYIDEATGAQNTVPPQAPLRAALDNVSGQLAVAVTPLTELAVQLSEDPLTHRIPVSGLSFNNARVAAAFKTDILGTMPADALSASATATGEQKEHALLLAAFARLMQKEGKDLQAVLAEFKDALAIDGKLAIPVAVQFQAALEEFATSAANKTGINDISSTKLINIGGSTRTLTLAVAGTSTSIAGIEAFVVLPPGVTVKAAADGTVPVSSLQPAGAAASNGFVEGYYTPASASMRGRIKIAYLSATGFAAGDFVTLQCDIAPDALVHDADFLPSLLTALSLSGASLNVDLAARLGQ